MRILLTGATGFIGRNLKEAWEARHELYAPPSWELDLLDQQAVENCLLDRRFDVVVHAANTNDVIHPERAPEQVERNLRMFLNLRRCSALYGRLYYFGSGAEYDIRHAIPRMPEAYFGRHVPGDAYGFSKYTMSLLADGNIFDLRLFGVFGKYEEWTRRFISNMIWQGMSGGTMTMRQNRRFDYLYIDDLVRIMDWFLTHEPQHHHYNVCTGQGVELLALANMVKEELDMPCHLVVSEPGIGAEYTGDNSRLLAETGPLELTPLTQAVRALKRFYEKNGFF